jgi:hypothetical protein
MFKLTSCVAALLVLAACSPSEGERAERAYEMVKKTALDRSDVCAASRKAREAWLAEGNQEKYELADIRVYSDCQPY